jgi:pseudouridine kinase
LRTSNPGTAITTPGGVGRNVAENLARLGTPAHLIAPIGRDPSGEQIVSATRAAGVSVDHLITIDGATGMYLAVIDANGELLLAVSDMAATDRLTVRDLVPARDLITNAGLLVVDGNIPPAPAAWLLDVAAAARVPVVLDPVSVAKAAHLRRTLSPQRPVLVLTPTHDELGAVVGEPVQQTRQGIVRAARAVHDLGARHVWVRRGARGSLLSSRGEDGRIGVVSLPAPAVTVVDVTGAGDAMTAAFVHAYLRGDSPVESARFGQVAAGLTCASPGSVRADLTARLIDAELRGVPRDAERRSAHRAGQTREGR